MATKIWKHHQISLLILVIRDGGSIVAVEELKNYPIWMKDGF